MSGVGDNIATVDRSIDLQAVTVRVWRFVDAPEKYQDLSDSPGDEEWLFHVPEGLVGHLECVPFLIQNPQSSLEARNVSQHDLPEGGRVYIGGCRE